MVGQEKLSLRLLGNEIESRAFALVILKILKSFGASAEEAKYET
tara:strand:+ start:2601 stop:2732 length:132 start_codon:yes stop_codon:yes gene_type:complete